MKKICGIYKITSPSGKIYIGQSNNILYRWKYHYEKLNCKGQRHLYNSFIKYGVTNHTFEIVETCSPDNCNELEEYYVNLYNTFESSNGLNLRAGGGNRTMFSKETIKKMRDNAIGNTNMLGKIHSEETKNRISNSKKGILVSEETKEKMSIARIGFKNSKETIEKMKLAKEKNKFTKKIINIETKEIFNSIGEAAISINKTPQALYNHFNRGTNIKFNLNYYEGNTDKF